MNPLNDLVFRMPEDLHLLRSAFECERFSVVGRKRGWLVRCSGSLFAVKWPAAGRIRSVVLPRPLAVPAEKFRQVIPTCHHIREVIVVSYSSGRAILLLALIDDSFLPEVFIVEKASPIHAERITASTVAR
jgi:hypothetical protein